MIENPMALSIPEAAQAVGVGRSTIYSEINAGNLRVLKVGDRSLIEPTELRRWLRHQAPSGRAGCTAPAPAGQGVGKAMILGPAGSHWDVRQQRRERRWAARDPTTGRWIASADEAITPADLRQMARIRNYDPGLDRACPHSERVSTPKQRDERNHAELSRMQPKRQRLLHKKPPRSLFRRPKLDRGRPG